jgi:hypothetical protein
MRRAILISIVAIILGVDSAWAQSSQSFEIGAQIPWANIGELDSTDVGFGGRASWQLSRWIGVEGELNFFPSDIPDSQPVSSNRVEGLFGVTVGPQINQWRPFARIRPGFLTVGSSPGPVVCLAIFPPTLPCTLAAGATLFAFDLGGGVDVRLSGKTFVRLDLGDRMVRYPSPVIDSAGEVHDNDFIGHDFRLAIGAGWRF